MKRRITVSGFTLAELLIALAILGVIATFTIPKVLTSQQNQSFKASTKEAAGMISGAYQAYQSEHTQSASTKLSDLTPYMNYVSVQTTGSLDNVYGMSGTATCTASTPCLRLHSGAAIRYAPGRCFYGTTGQYGLSFHFDPDGKVTGNSALTNGPGKALNFWIYYDGRLTTSDGIVAGTRRGNTVCSGTDGPYSAGDPALGQIADWFSWN